MKTPESSDCPRSVALGTTLSDDLYARRGPLARVYHHPPALLQLLHLVEVTALDVVLRAVPAQRAEQALHFFLLQPGGDRLVVGALGRRQRRFEHLPGRIHDRRLQVDGGVRDAGFLGALAIGLDEPGDRRIVGEWRMLLERGQRERALRLANLEHRTGRG